METKEQYMVTPVMDFAETVKTVEKMKKNAEANVAFANQLKANIVALQNSVKQDVTSYSNKTCHHLTANQKRARIIATAKLFVEDQKTCHTGTVAKGNPHEGKIRTYKGIYKRTQGNIMYLSNAEFIRKGNRVTCLLKGVETNKVHFVGRAKCHVDDVFNEHIGRAVALAKALDIVEQLPPDILNAARPNSFVKGMKVVWVDDFGCANERIVERVENSKVFFTNKSNMPKDRLTIIDDTNADYSLQLQGGEN